MTVSVILTVVGKDRPGLTQALADAVHASGGNWHESKLSRLGGQYVGAVLVEIGEGDLPGLQAAMRAIDPGTLSVSVIDAAEEAQGDAANAAGHALRMELVGADRPGIVREVTSVLARLAVNIEELETDVTDGAWSGERIFRATASLIVPPSTDPATVIAALEAISAEIMVELEVEAGLVGA